MRLATRGGERRQFGIFETEEEAAVAYDAAVMELYGPRTPTNFVTAFGAPWYLQGASLQLMVWARKYRKATYCQRSFQSGYS